MKGEQHLHESGIDVWGSSDFQNALGSFIQIGSQRKTRCADESLDWGRAEDEGRTTSPRERDRCLGIFRFPECSRLLHSLLSQTELPAHRAELRAAPLRRKPVQS